MSEEEEIKKRLLAQRMQEIQAQQLEEHSAAHMRENVKSMLRSMLDEGARERLNNIRTVNPQLAETLEMYIVQAYQSGQLRHKLSERDIIEILKHISPKKDFNIRRK